MIDVSEQEAILALVRTNVASAIYHGATWSRVPERPPALGRLKCSDGYVVALLIEDRHWLGFVELMGNPEWAAGPEWSSLYYRAGHLMEIADRIAEWAAKQRKEDLHHRGAAKGFAIGSVYNAEEVMNYRQYAARDYFVEVEHPQAGKMRYAGWPYKMPASPPRIQRPAPLLGEHNREVLEGAGYSAEEFRRAVPCRSSLEGGRAMTGAAPLRGVRVLDFTWVWAGPYATMLLAMLGAEVIKIESRDRMDVMRRVIVWPLFEPVPQEIPPNEGASFGAINMNKLGITLNLDRPEGIDLVKRLVAVSDVVFENMRPGVMDKMGIGYEALREVNPKLIMLSSSARGATGPEREYAGYATVHHAVGGAAEITGYPDGPPSTTFGDVDLVNATAAAFAVIARPASSTKRPARGSTSTTRNAKA